MSCDAAPKQFKIVNVSDTHIKQRYAVIGCLMMDASSWKKSVQLRSVLDSKTFMVTIPLTSVPVTIPSVLFTIEISIVRQWMRCFKSGETNVTEQAVTERNKSRIGAFIKEICNVITLNCVMQLALES